MATIEFWKLSEAEFEMEEVNPFCLNGFYLNGSALNIYKFVPVSCTCLWQSVFPYISIAIPIPRGHPFKKLFDDIDFPVIYEAGDVQESQELAMDPFYVRDCSMDPPKARALHAELVPNYPEQNLELCTVLTSYGELAVMYRDKLLGDWEPLNTNLSTILIPETISQISSTNKIKRFSELRNLTQQYRISYFCWDKTKPIMYLGTAAGCIIPLLYDTALKQFQNLNSLETEIGEIAYLMNFENFLLASSRQGSIHLYRIDRDTNELKHSECLYNNPDGMTCQRALMQYNGGQDVYNLLFAKTAHLMVYCISKEGKILANAVQYINGIKITGMEILGVNEFVVTTIVSQIKLIRISYTANDNCLKIEEFDVKHNIDLKHFQILDISSIGKRYLWSLVLYRNKTMHYFSKWSNPLALVIICRLSSLNTLEELKRYIQSDSLDECFDLMVAICLDIRNRINLDEYKNFMDLEKLQYTNDLSNDFINEMRIKYFLEKQLIKYDRCKSTDNDFYADIRIHFLRNALQMMHISKRLQYLKTLELETLTDFQKKAINCMQIKYFELTLELKKLIEDDTVLKEAISDFLKFIETMEVHHFRLDNMKFDFDHCLICDEILTLNYFATCKNDHAIRRCTVSFVQLPFAEWRYCPQCNAMALPESETISAPNQSPESPAESTEALISNESAAVPSSSSSITRRNYLLEELFPPNELIRCTFCNFLLKQSYDI